MEAGTLFLIFIIVILVGVVFVLIGFLAGNSNSQQPKPKELTWDEQKENIANAFKQMQDDFKDPVIKKNIKDGLKQVRKFKDK